MDGQTEAFFLMIVAAMKDVADSKNNSHLTQLKAVMEIVKVNLEK